MGIFLFVLWKGPMENCQMSTIIISHWAFRERMKNHATRFWRHATTSKKLLSSLLTVNRLSGSHPCWVLQNKRTKRALQDLAWHRKSHTAGILQGRIWKIGHLQLWTCWVSGRDCCPENFWHTYSHVTQFFQNCWKITYAYCY